jgi:hypothetical protein
VWVGLDGYRAVITASDVNQNPIHDRCHPDNPDEPARYGAEWRCFHDRSGNRLRLPDKPDTQVAVACEGRHEVIQAARWVGSIA